MNTIIDFFSFNDPSIVSVVVGSVLITISSAVIGVFAFLKKKALVGDAVAHSVLPGICIAFMWSGTKNPIILIIGAFITGWISLVLIDHLTHRTKIKEDTAIAMVLSVFFGIGVLLLTYIQHGGNASQTGLNSFLFGKAASLMGNDLIVFGVVAILLIVTTVFFFKELKLIAFDPDFARTIGLPVNKFNLLLTFLTVMAIVTGIQAVGVVLMAAVLITPAVAARFWTQNVRNMTLLAALMGAISGLFGAFVSYIAPAMPTGPWIVMIISVIVLFSILFASKKGLFLRYLRKRTLKLNMMDENLLKELYHLGEKHHELFRKWTISDIIGERYFPNSQLRKSLNRLKRQGVLEKHDIYWKLTKNGEKRGKRVVKLHRLWELYLSNYVKINSNQVHESAETIEHIITPEIESQLEKMMKFPKLDPHDTKIPY